jgi:putative ABC transport system substrate-binding protein
MKRREFITLLGGAAAARPLAAHAQRQAMPVIGFLHFGSSAGFSYVLPGFRERLKQFGYAEGHNVAIEYRWANNESDGLPELVADLVRRQVAVIAACAGPLPGLSAKAATSTIPIVVVLGTDPVRTGLVASLNRPGGNVTGVYFLTRELVPKRLDLVHELVPQATTVAYLADDQRTETAQETMRDMLAAAGVLGRQLAVVEARNDRDFEPAFGTFIGRQAGALVVGGSRLAKCPPKMSPRRPLGCGSSGASRRHCTGVCDD